MKVGIIGAGALGSLYAHYFHDHLIDFVIYEKNGDAVSEINKNGLTLIKGESSRSIKPEISTSPEILGDAEIVFIFVKSYSTAEALDDVSFFLNKSSIIVSLQNGLGNVEEIRKIIEPERIVYGTTTFGASKSSYSTVVAGGAGVVNIGGAEAGHVLKVHHLLNSVDLNSYTVDDPDLFLWNKAVINAGINPVAAILGITNGEILSNSFAALLMENILREAVNAASANCINMEFPAMLKATREVCEKTSTNRCSMLQDITNGRKTEIESINGTIIEAGKNKGLDMPCNSTIFLLIKSLETIR